MKNVRKPLLDSNALPLSSLGNPFVHSLLVTLGNHAVHDVRTYNWPCPVGPSGDIGDGRLDISRKQFPGRSAGSVKTRIWSLQSYGVVWLQQTEGTQQCGEVCPAGQDSECHR